MSRIANRKFGFTLLPEGWGSTGKEAGSIRLDASERHDLGPLLRLGGDEFLEVVGRAGEHVAAEIGEALPRRRIVERGIDLFVERLDHRPRRSLRRDDAVPAVRLVARQK